MAIDKNFRFPLLIPVPNLEDYNEGVILEELDVTSVVGLLNVMQKLNLCKRVREYENEADLGYGEYGPVDFTVRVWA